MSTGMPIADLLHGVADATGAGDIVVHGLSMDSRRVRPGDAFVALRGGTVHGVRFAPEAARQGACVVLADAPAPGATTGAEHTDVPTLWIDDLRAQLGSIAARFFGQPSIDLRVIGVTGTNGKTSTVQLLAQALARLGHAAASIGTLGAGLVSALERGERTTPDVISTHALLARFRDQGASHVAMEVSSHALVQGRVDAVDFDIAVFTNLTRDHLDYHGSMQAYGEAKASLFAWPSLSTAVINVDDAFGRDLVARLPATVQCLRVGVESDDADVRASGVETSATGLTFQLHTPWGAAQVACALLGRFNVANLLAVVASLGAMGESLARIVAVIGALEPVPGRMSRLGGTGGLPLLVVDYAHTPDALQQALENLRAHCAGRLMCVFGCGGERDKGKRPEMGAIAERLADLAIITDDNPRGEDGDAIVADIVAGLRNPGRVLIERDRAAAIALALARAQAGDVVLVAGKGHEDYQEIAGQKHPFDDLQVARVALEARAC